MLQDEARCGRMNDPRACWAPRSVRPLVGAQVVRELVDAFGATSLFHEKASPVKGSKATVVAAVVAAVASPC